MRGNEAAPVAYWPCDERLRGLVSGYHRYRVAMPPGHALQDVFFPSWSVVRFAIDDPEPWSIRRGTRTFDPVPAAMLEGPSSYAGYCRSTRGTLIGFGLLPEGWARLIGVEADGLANRVVPLDTIWPDAGALHGELAASDDPRTVLDAWLLARLDRAPPADPLIARLYAMLEDPAEIRIEQLAAKLGVSRRTLVMLCKRHFGFTPKLLLRRARFLRALSAGLAQESGWDAVLDAAGYWDRSHFLRDCNLFLGCSLREFQARQGPLNAMAMVVRAKVLGSPV